MSEDALAARLAGLSPESRALLARRLAERRGERTHEISRRRPDAPVPISYAQWRLWFLEQLRPGTNAWNTPVAVRVRGPLDLGALRDAMQLLVDRHATLRTVFPAPGGTPQPTLLEPPRIELPVRVPPTADERAVRAFVDAEVARPFDLQRELMFRAAVLQLGAEDHVLVLVAHHIACDGWSKGLLLRELGVAYEALSHQREPALPELPIEYADYAIWQRELLTGGRLAQLSEYWKERLAGAPPALPLPTDHPRPARQSFRGAVRWVDVPAPLADGLIAVGRSERATPFMTLMAAFLVLLHAHSGEDDLLVGSPSAMRVRPELEQVVGLFANTLVYRTSLAGAPSFREVVRRVRETALGVYAHQDMPFEKIVEVVRPPRDASRNPIVQVNIRVEGREPELRLAGAEVEPLPLDPGIARFDLAIELGETDDGYAGYLEYDSALFDVGTAAGYADDFRAIIAACVTAPDREIAALDCAELVRARGPGKGHHRYE